MNMHVVITGANRGIGLSFVREYIVAGHSVTALCRSPSDELKQSGATIIDGVDVTSWDSMELIKNKIEQPIDILINNAGVLNDEGLGSIDYESVIKQFEVNAVGPLRITEALLEKFNSNAKVALITSRMGSIQDNSSGAYYGYRMSKAALNAAGKSLANDLKPKGIAVAILHPGFVKTEMVNHAGDISPDVAASRLAERIDQLSIANTGSFWHSNGELLPW